MKIIITGALGHIGSLLIRALPKKIGELNLILIDDLSTQRYTSLFNLESSNYKFIEAKAQEVNLDPLLKDATCLIHLAAITDAAGTANEPDKIFQNNFEATKVASQACLKNKVPIIFPSSTSVYGSQSNIVDENCNELAPQSPYAACKIKEEEYLKNLFKQGLNGTILRLGTIYGPSPGMRFHTAVNKFCWQAVMNQPLSVWETALHQKRPYLALEDCSQVISLIIRNRLYTGEIYNIVSNNVTVQNVVDEIKKHKPNLVINLVQHKIMNQLSYEVSSDKFKKTGFNFNGTLDSGISRTMSLLKNANSEQ